MIQLRELRRRKRDTAGTRKGNKRRPPPEERETSTARRPTATRALLYYRLRKPENRYRLVALFFLLALATIRAYSPLSLAYRVRSFFFFLCMCTLTSFAYSISTSSMFSPRFMFVGNIDSKIRYLLRWYSSVETLLDAGHVLCIHFNVEAHTTQPKQHELILN